MYKDEFKEIREAIQKWAITKKESDIISLSIFANNEEFDFEIKTRSYESLDGQSMKNVAGEWIENPKRDREAF